MGQNCVEIVHHQIGFGTEHMSRHYSSDAKALKNESCLDGLQYIPVMMTCPMAGSQTDMFDARTIQNNSISDLKLRHSMIWPLPKMITTPITSLRFDVVQSDECFQSRQNHH
jgi:hypothetical protein